MVEAIERFLEVQGKEHRGAAGIQGIHDYLEEVDKGVVDRTVLYSTVLALVKWDLVP